MTGRALAVGLLPALASCSFLVDVPGLREGFGDGDIRRKRIEIESPHFEDLDNYTFAVIINGDPDLAARIRFDNVAFSDEDGVPLAHEIDRLDEEAGSIVAWVRLPVLRTGVDGARTVIYIFYGGPSRDEIDPGDVWHDEFAGVWHLNGAGPEYRDSTRPDNDAAVVGGSAPVEDAGDGSLVFDGDAQLQVSTDLDDDLNFGLGSFSYAAWVRIDAPTSGESFPLIKGGIPEDRPGYALRASSDDWEAAVSDGIMQRELGIGNDPQFVGKWSLLSVIVNRDDTPQPTVCTFTDGLSDSCSEIASVGSMTSNLPLIFGDNLVGKLDEVRIYNQAISPDRLFVEYQNLTFPQDLIAVGGEEM